MYRLHTTLEKSVRRWIHFGNEDRTEQSKGKFVFRSDILEKDLTKLLTFSTPAGLL